MKNVDIRGFSVFLMGYLFTKILDFRIKDFRTALTLFVILGAYYLIIWLFGNNESNDQGTKE
jgi:membrane protein DedA with SNARE-associated domain